VTGSVRLWIVYMMAGTLGLITALDQPVKVVIVLDLVGPADLTNAISLNMALSNTSRVLGPALAGVTIAAVGVGPCFLLNASWPLIAGPSALPTRFQSGIESSMEVSNGRDVEGPTGAPPLDRTRLRTRTAGWG
jgi:predicted MFS family arabinose efflux permease